MNIRIAILVCALMALLPSARAQTSPPDSLQLSLQGFYALSLPYHPLARQAYLLPESARMQVRMARGFFDPKLESDYNQKIFGDKNYYQLWNSYLKAPLWIGEVKGGYERNRGSNVNPESDTDKGKGLAYLGIELPIGRGLLMDERRAALRQAQAFTQQAEAEQVKELNKLILKMAKDYWEWYFAYHQLRLQQQGYELARVRFRGIQQQVAQGDLAAIDTVEALITVQQRDIDLRTAEVELQNALLQLSNHLWDEEGRPLEFSEQLRPSALPQAFLQTQDLEAYRAHALSNNPELQVLLAQQQQVIVERRLAIEQLKPTINLRYNLLLRPDGMPDGLNGIPWTQDFKWGATFSMPLLLRKERGKLGSVKIKLQQLALKQQYYQQNILTEVASQYNQVRTLQTLGERQAQMLDNYRRLLAGETQKFRNGESSLFLLNTRESKMIEAEVKLYKVRAQLAKSMAELRWAAGMGLE